jgi:PAS domain-containing protein
MLSIVASYQPAFDETGEVVGISISVADITEVKRRDTVILETAEQSRRALELKNQALVRGDAMLAAVIEATPVGIVIAESPGETIVSANAKAREILGMDLLPGAKWDESSWEACDEFGRPVALRDLPLSLAIRSGESSEAVGVRLRRADSSTVWISLTAAPVRAQGGAIIGGVLALQDIHGAKLKNERIMDLASQLSVLASSDIHGSRIRSA